jgi:hypothetical protein
MGIFLEEEDSNGDHGLGSLAELRFKTPPGTSYYMLYYTYIYITNYLNGTT